VLTVPTVAVVVEREGKFLLVEEDIENWDVPVFNQSAGHVEQGETLIDVPAQPAGTKMRGVCSMGMYSFTVNFL
jgi:hypothetical protein